MEHEAGSWFEFLYLIKVGGHPLLPHWVPIAIPYSILVALVLCLVSYFGLRPGRRVPTGLQNALEAVVEALNGLSRGLLGDQAPRFAPFLGTFFLYIMIMNLLGLIPGFISPTSNLNITLGLALIVFVTVQYYGVKENGVLGYIQHFTGGILRGVRFSWRSLGMYLLAVGIIMPIELIGELTRPATLAVRLYGNVMGGETVIGQLVSLSPVLFGRSLDGLFLGLPIPVAFPMMMLEIFTGTVQALVFTLLAAAYLAGVTAHAEGH